MVLSVGNQSLTAAAPEVVNALVAFKAFNDAMGSDPMKWVVNYPGAKLIFLGTLLQQVPALVQAEGGVVHNVLNSAADDMISKINAAVAAQSATPPPVMSGTAS